jgi:hypothetical protein
LEYEDQNMILLNLEKMQKKKKYSDQILKGIPLFNAANTPCSRPRWRGRELGASWGRKLRRSIAIPPAGVIVAIHTPIPPLDGEHPQFAGAASSTRSSRFRRLPAGRQTGDVGQQKGSIIIPLCLDNVHNCTYNRNYGI